MFRFSVRDLLWLTLVVAVGLGWLVHQRNVTIAAQKEVVLWKARATADRELRENAERKAEWLNVQILNRKMTWRAK